jgi:hypothetical protein
VVVLVHEHPVVAAQPAPERVELLAELRVGVEPRVARQPAFAPVELGLGAVVAEGGRDDRPRVGEQRVRMARDLGTGHGEPHVGEEPARAALGDVPLGLLIGLGRRGADHVDPEFVGEPFELFSCHKRHFAANTDTFPT